MSKPKTDQPRKGSERLGRTERFWAALLGSIFTVVGFLLIFDPPKISESIELEQCRSASDCVAEVSWNSEVIVSAILGAALICFLVAILGVRFNRFKVGDHEASSEVSVEETDGDTAKKETKNAKTALLKEGGVVAQSDSPDVHAELTDADVVGQIETVARSDRPIEAWDLAPQWATAQIENLVDDDPSFDGPAGLVVAAAWKLPGQGSRRWYFRLEETTGEERTVRVSRGRPPGS